MIERNQKDRLLEGVVVSTDRVASSLSSNMDETTLSSSERLSITKLGSPEKKVKKKKKKKKKKDVASSSSSTVTSPLLLPPPSQSAVSAQTRTGFTVMAGEESIQIDNEVFLREERLEAEKAVQAGEEEKLGQDARHHRLQRALSSEFDFPRTIGGDENETSTKMPFLRPIEEFARAAAEMEILHQKRRKKAKKVKKSRPLTAKASSRTSNNDNKPRGEPVADFENPDDYVGGYDYTDDYDEYENTFDNSDEQESVDMLNAAAQSTASIGVSTSIVSSSPIGVSPSSCLQRILCCGCLVSHANEISVSEEGSNVVNSIAVSSRASSGSTSGGSRRMGSGSSGIGSIGFGRKQKKLEQFWGSCMLSWSERPIFTPLTTQAALEVRTQKLAIA